MAIDREALQRAAKAAADRARSNVPSGVAGLISSLHRGDLANFVTIESTAFPPVPLRADSALGVVVAAPTQGEEWTPWGVVEWRWPGGALLRRERLSNAVARPITFRPDVASFAECCTAAEAHLAGNPVAARELIEQYRRLVGREGIEFMSTVFPGASELWSAS